MVSSSVSDRELDWLTSLGFSGSLSDMRSSREAQSSSLADLPIYLYGNSLAVLTGQTFYTLGKHYSQKVAAALRAQDPVSYAVGGRRILDVCSTLINGGALVGVTGQVAAGKWPGVSQRPGLVVIDSLQNDIPHYAAMNVSPLVPVALPTANSNYINGIKSMFRTALALISSESRIEQDAGGVVRTGTWTPSVNAAYSNGGLHLTSTIGDNILYPAVTPPQSGPLAGKVFHLGYRLDGAVGVVSTVNVSIDGGGAVAYASVPWEAYTNVGGASSTIIPDVQVITLPVDGAAHSVRFTQAGAAGQFMYSDAIIIPSINPYPIAVLEATQSPQVHAGVYGAGDVAVWVANRGQVQDAARQVVTEFPHAIWINDGRSPNAIYSGDGIHPNDRGMSQRAADLVYGVRQALVDTQIKNLADSSFGVI